MNPPVRKVFCECCRREALAYVVNGQLVIVDRRHGETHSVTLSAEDLRELGVDQNLPPLVKPHLVVQG